MLDATPAQLEFMEGELRRFIENGAWELGRRARWVSRLFLVPKPGVNKWRLIIDLRPLNKFCRTLPLKYEGLKRLRTLGRQNDWMLSADLADGFYCLGIAEEDRDFFTVDYRGTLYRLAGLPMGWSLSPYYFCTFVGAVVKYLRSPLFARAPVPKTASKRYLRNQRWRGVRMIPFVDDYLFLAGSYEEALALRDFIDELFLRLGIGRNVKKGCWEPVQCLEHLGLEIDTVASEFRAPQEKLDRLSKQAKELLQRAARNRRWVPVRLLASLAGKAQFLYLAIPPARYYLRELHNVVGHKTSWGGLVKLTRQLKRDLEWWAAVPKAQNGRPIFRGVETAYLHVDSSSYGWGAVLNDCQEARGFWYEEDRDAHITFKELKAVRYAVESFLPHLMGRRVLLHEDNTAVCAVLTHLTTRSPAMMVEVRKLWYLLDTHDIKLRAKYIRSAANIWADKLSREIDTADWSLNPRLFRHINRVWGPHTVDRFASMENALLERYNSKWRDPRAEDVDALHLSDAAWRRETNWCNPPWELLDDLVLKLRRSGAAATVVTPLWPDRAWHQELLSLASEFLVYPPSRDLFVPGRHGRRVGVGRPRWSVVVFRVPRRPGST